MARAVDGLLEGAGAAPRFEWPVRLAPGSWAGGTDLAGLVVRELRVGDEPQWRRLRLSEDARLSPWEATLPSGSGEQLADFRAFVRAQTRRARLGWAMPFVVEVDGDFAGQVAVEPIVWGSTRSAQVGYWVGSAWQGRGIMRLAVALVVDHLLSGAGLHRVEINVRPDNRRSLALCRGLGLREEGVRRAYMHIDGAWADHVSFAVVDEEVREPVGVSLQERFRRRNH